MNGEKKREDKKKREIIIRNISQPSSLFVYSSKRWWRSTRYHLHIVIRRVGYHHRLATMKQMESVETNMKQSSWKNRQIVLVYKNVPCSFFFFQHILAHFGWGTVSYWQKPFVIVNLCIAGRCPDVMWWWRR